MAAYVQQPAVPTFTPAAAKKIADHALKSGVAKEVQLVNNTMGDPKYAYRQLLFDGKLVGLVSNGEEIGNQYLEQVSIPAAPAEPGWKSYQVAKVDVGPIKLGPTTVHIGPVGSPPPFKGLAVDPPQVKSAAYQPNYPQVQSAEFEQGNVGATWTYELVGSTEQMQWLLSKIPPYDVLSYQDHGDNSFYYNYAGGIRSWTIKTAKPIDGATLGMDEHMKSYPAQMAQFFTAKHSTHLSDPVGTVSTSCPDCLAVWDARVKKIMVSYHVQLDRLASDLTPEQRVRVLAAFHSAAYVDMVDT